MVLKQLLDNVNAAASQVQAILRQVEDHLNAGENEQAMALQPQLDAAKVTYDKANQLYLSVLNAQSNTDPATHFAPSVQVTRDEGDQPFASDGEMFLAVKRAALGDGFDPRLRSRKVLDATGINEQNPAEGGYLLSPQTSQKWLENMYSVGEILRRVSRDPVGPNSNSMTYKGIDETSRVDGSRKGGIQAGWVGEGGTISGSKPKYREVEIKLRKDGALVYATDEQMQDTPNLESWINRAVPEELVFVAEDAVIEGIGGAMPLGIMKSPSLLTLPRDTASTVKFADIIAMWARRYAGLRDYVWLVHQDVMPQLDSMVIGTDAPPRFVDYGVDGTVRMKGCPVLEVEYAQSLNTSGDIMLASLSQYQVIDKAGVQSASSIHVGFVTGEMCWRFTYRMGGAPLWHSVVTPFHGSNTVSPFVVLGSASA